MRKLTIVLSLALLAIVTACGSGGGDGGGEKNFTAGFTPDEPNPGADSVAMAESAAGGGQVLIDINITDTTTGVFGAAFTVTYDTSKATFAVGLGRARCSSRAASPCTTTPASPRRGRSTSWPPV